MGEDTKERIESELEVKSYLQNLRYALENVRRLIFRQAPDLSIIKEMKNIRTNIRLINIFPDENPVDALKKELKMLTVEEYMRTESDLKFPNRSEMRNLEKSIMVTTMYIIKIRVELLGMYGNSTTFVMSFHFAERALYQRCFHIGINKGGIFMDMKVIRSEKRLCTCCMEEHEVKTVRVMERASFKKCTGRLRGYLLFCDAAEELYMNESQIQENDIAIKDAYRKKQMLLTSKDINAIRGKYGISQSDLCILLAGW